MQIEQKKHAKSKLKELYIQQKSLSGKVSTLKKYKLEEQEDVKRLEGRSLSYFFYKVIGKMDEKLDKEREEAYAARVKYDVAAFELRVVEEDIKRYEEVLNELSECEEQYDLIVKEKLKAVKSLGNQDAEKIIRTEENISYLEGLIKEIEEALVAGKTALRTTNSILSSLNSADGWGTWDLLGGGALTSVMKHDHLDKAQKQVEHLQVQLNHFKTELTDVSISANMKVSIDGFLLFADYFFDGVFADWVVLDKINKSQAQVKNTKRDIENVINHLTTMLSATNENLKNEKLLLNNLITKAKI